MNLLNAFKKIIGRHGEQTVPEKKAYTGQQHKRLDEYFVETPSSESDMMHGRSISTMGEIAACFPMFVRFVKSSDAAAKNSLEGWKRIPTEPNSISAVSQDAYPMSMTTPQCALTCLGYGDAVAYIPVTKDIVSEYGLENEPIWRTGNSLDEYNARRFYVSDVKSLADPETLCELVRTSSDSVLQAKLLEYYTPSPFRHDVFLCLQRQGFEETAQFWRWLQEYFASHIENGELILTTREIQENISNLYAAWQEERAEPTIGDDDER